MNDLRIGDGDRLDFDLSIAPEPRRAAVGLLAIQVAPGTAGGRTGFGLASLEERKSNIAAEVGVAGELGPSDSVVAEAASRTARRATTRASGFWHKALIKMKEVEIKRGRSLRRRAGLRDTSENGDSSLHGRPLPSPDPSLEVRGQAAGTRSGLPAHPLQPVPRRQRGGMADRRKCVRV